VQRTLISRWKLCEWSSFIGSAQQN